MAQEGPRITVFTSQPRGKYGKWSKKVWIAARMFIGGPPSSMTMIPAQRRFRGNLTKTTKWIIEHGSLSEPIEIDGPSGQVYEALLKMRRDEQ